MFEMWLNTLLLPEKTGAFIVFIFADCTERLKPWGFGVVQIPFMSL
jgi:hypothetical protein